LPFHRLDALVTKRCYKDAYPVEMSLDILRREKGGHFDPDVLEAFLGVLDETLALYERSEGVTGRQ